MACNALTSPWYSRFASLYSANRVFDIVNETKYKLYEKQDVKCSIPDGYEYNTPYPIPEDILNAEDNQEEVDTSTKQEETTPVNKKNKRFRANTKVISWKNQKQKQEEVIKKWRVNIAKKL